jgi:hypothetical protein
MNDKLTKKCHGEDEKPKNRKSKWNLFDWLIDWFILSNIWFHIQYLRIIH